MGKESRFLPNRRRPRPIGAVRRGFPRPRRGRAAGRPAGILNEVIAEEASSVPSTSRPRPRARQRPKEARRLGPRAGRGNGRGRRPRDRLPFRPGAGWIVGPDRRRFLDPGVRGCNLRGGAFRNSGVGPAQGRPAPIVTGRVVRPRAEPTPPGGPGRGTGRGGNRTAGRGRGHAVQGLSARR